MTILGVARLGGIVTAMMLGFYASAQAADPPMGSQACSQQLSELSTQWNSIGMPPNTKPAQSRSDGRGGHSHTGGEVTFMRTQLGMAGRLCKDGRDHEAMVRMDVVRALLKLADVDHPAGHRYQPVRR